MQQFKIPAEGLAKLRKKILIRSIPVMLISVAIGLAMSTFNNNTKNTDVDISFTLPFILFFVLLMSFALYRGIKKQMTLLKSYTLIFENNTITRQQLNTPTIAISFSDITQIAKNKNGAFTIKTKNPRDVIGVPVQVENYNELEQLLNEIVLITEKRETFIEKYKIVISVLTLGAIVTVYDVQNKFIAAAAGIVSIGILIWSLLEIQKNKNVDNRTRRNSWIVLIVVASIIGRIIVKLTSEQ